MATDTHENIDRMPAEEIASTISSVEKMLVVGGLFAAVGYLLVGAALFFEFTQFHPLIDEFVRTQTQHSLAGGGPDRAGDAVLNSQLAEIHRWPSTLLWMKLGGIAHVLVGIFVALAAIVRVLGLMPHRLSYEMERAQQGAVPTPEGDGSSGGAPGGAAPGDD